MGIKPVGESQYYVKLKQNNGLGLSYRSINETNALPISFGEWQKDFFHIHNIRKKTFCFTNVRMLERSFVWMFAKTRLFACLVKNRDSKKSERFK